VGEIPRGITRHPPLKHTGILRWHRFTAFARPLPRPIPGSPRIIDVIKKDFLLFSFSSQSGIQSAP
jgi:hypothetical protein